MLYVHPSLSFVIYLSSTQNSRELSFANAEALSASAGGASAAAGALSSASSGPSKDAAAEAIAAAEAAASLPSESRAALVSELEAFLAAATAAAASGSGGSGGGGGGSVGALLDAYAARHATLSLPRATAAARGALLLGRGGAAASSLVGVEPGLRRGAFSCVVCEDAAAVLVDAGGEAAAGLVAWRAACGARFPKSLAFGTVLRPIAGDDEPTNTEDA